MKKFFEIQDKIRKNLIENDRINDMLKIAFYVSTIAFFIIGGWLFPKDNENIVMNIILIILAAVSIISGFLSRVRDLCTSISIFIRRSLLLTVILGAFFYLLIMIYIGDAYILYGVLILIYTLIWTFLSTISDTKVGIISNAVVAVILEIILQANSFIWQILEIDGVKVKSLLIVHKVGLNDYEIMELAINTALFPFFVMVTVGALACVFKEYWAEGNKE